MTCRHAHLSPPASIKDPVCGMTVDPDKTPHHAEHDGTTFHFYSGRFRERFLTDPAEQLTPPAAVGMSTVPESAVWTCPMHPEIRRNGADDLEEDVALEAIVVGDRLRVRPGEAIPVDGVVLEGRSSVDEAASSFIVVINALRLNGAKL